MRKTNGLLRRLIFGIGAPAHRPQAPGRRLAFEPLETRLCLSVVVTGTVNIGSSTPVRNALVELEITGRKYTDAGGHAQRHAQGHGPGGGVHQRQRELRGHR